MEVYRDSEGPSLGLMPLPGGAPHKFEFQNAKFLCDSYGYSIVSCDSYGYIQCELNECAWPAPFSYDRLRVGRGPAREEDAQGTPIQSHISPSILVYENINWINFKHLGTGT